MRRIPNKSLIILLAIVAPFWATAASGAEPDVNRPIRDKWALVVGISEFANPKINLRYPAKDAKDFATYLVEEAGFARDHVKVLINQDATEKRILSELGNKWLPRVANPDDLVVLFISTHGSGAELDVGGQNYLLAYDTDIDDLYTSGIPMQKLARDIKERIHCDRVVIFLDACHSGATTTGGASGSKGLFRSGVDAAEVAAGSGQLVITSSKDDQVSWESKTKTNSVFTEKLIEALRSKGGQATLGQIYDSLKEQVQNTVLRERGVLQTPVMKSEWKGNDLILASQPTNPQPGLEESGSSAAIHIPVPENPTPDQTRAPSQNQTIAQAPQKGIETTRIAWTASPTPQGSTVGSSAATNKPPQRPGSMVVPGKSVGRTRLGMSREEISGMLGKPTQTIGDVLIYRSQDRRNFLALRFKSDILNDIAFSSPAFSTEDGTNVKSFDGVIDKTTESKFATRHALSNGTTIYENKSGGLLFITGGGSEVGVVTNTRSAEFDTAWLPAQPVTVTNAKVNPIVPAQSTTAPTGAPAQETNAAPGKSDLIVPGKAMNRAVLGMSKEAVLKLFGKPANATDAVMTFSSSQRKTFLSLLFRDDKLVQVAFTSRAFTTKDGIGTGNFDEPAVRKKFLPPIKIEGGKYLVYTLSGGGFSIAVSSDGKIVGCVHAVSDMPSKIFWPQ